MRHVLLVEDDEFKAADVSRMLDEMIPGSDIVRAASVTSALRHISSTEFDLVVLDMSLPTFDLSGPGGGGSPQGQGGVEVLRLSKRLGHNSPIIVITQYPDIEVDGVEISLDQAAARLSDRFSCHVLKCVPYEFDSDAWRFTFTESIKSL